jgi:hypothetical protein
MEIAVLIYSESNNFKHLMITIFVKAWIVMWSDVVWQNF